MQIRVSRTRVLQLARRKQSMYYQQKKIQSILFVKRVGNRFLIKAVIFEKQTKQAHTSS